jgi:hypothetical protein
MRDRAGILIQVNAKCRRAARRRIPREPDRRLSKPATFRQPHPGRLGTEFLNMNFRRPDALAGRIP